MLKLEPSKRLMVMFCIQIGQRAKKGRQNNFYVVFMIQNLLMEYLHEKIIIKNFNYCNDNMYD